MILDIFQPQSTTIDHNQIILVNFRHFPTTINHNRPQSTYQKSTTINQNCGWKMSKINHNYQIVVDCGRYLIVVEKCLKSTKIIRLCLIVVGKCLKSTKIIWLWSIVVDCGWKMSKIIKHYQIVVDCGQVWLKNV